MQIVVYLLVVFGLISYILEDVKQCPYCKRRMHLKRTGIIKMWVCKCGCEIWKTID